MHLQLKFQIVIANQTKVIDTKINLSKNPNVFKEAHFEKKKLKFHTRVSLKTPLLPNV
jgi:hypothetical protein